MSEQEPVQESSASSPSWVKRNGKKAVFIVVGLFVAATIVKSVIPASIHLPSSNGGNTQAQDKKTKDVVVPVVTLNGALVPASSGALLTLSPGLVRPGITVTASGSGFDAGSLVDVILAADGSSRSITLGTATASKDGIVTVGFPFPSGNTAPSQKVTATERNSSKTASATILSAVGSGQVTLSANTGKPGDNIQLSAQGFGPSENINVFWGKIDTHPITSFKADEHGSLSKVTIPVSAVAVGPASLLVVGATSGTVATAIFTVQSIYPSVSLRTYVVKAAQPIGFTGKNFVPNERVLVYINSASGTPIEAIQTNKAGSFSADGFVVPFSLTGSQSLIFTGEQSRASVSAGFTVQPYTPSVRASTYGGLPGTVLTFYATGFGPNEVVKVFINKDKSNPGTLVSAFRVDARGTAAAAGKYLVPSSAGDSLPIAMVGSLSHGVGSVTFKVDKSVPVNIPASPAYVLPADLNN